MSGALIKRLVALGVVAALAGGLAGFAYWWTHPTLFRSVGFDLAYYRPVAVSTGEVTAGVLVPLQDNGGAVITLRNATVNFAAGSARASATFAICDGDPVGLIVTPTTPHCTRIGGVPGRIDLTSRGAQTLLMSVRPTSAGVVRITSISVSYREGSDHLWRQGSETLPITLTFTAR